MNNPALSSQLSRLQLRALLIGIIAAVLTLVVAIPDRAQFFHSYLFAWLFWSGLSFGALVVTMMQYLTGGQWGLALRPLANAAFTILPVMGLLFLPVLIGMNDIYGWTHGALGDAGGGHKRQWLNPPFFTARSAIYFGLLSTIALLIRRWSLAENGLPSVAPRLKSLSAGGLIVYVLCMNFASTDWVMSLDPQWYSTIFVVIFIAGQFLSALALLTGMLVWLTRDSAPGEGITAKVCNDLGNMLLAFVIFWTYVSFSQFLIIWSGNLPKEISWYLERSSGGWQWLALALVVCQFVLPFALLLSRAAKRNKQRLAGISLFIVLANILNNFWLVAPSFHPAGIHVHWLDVTNFLAIGGLWFALFFFFLKQSPLLPRELLEVPSNG